MPVLLAFLLLLQGPGEAWNLVETPPREVERVHWDLFETTEVWVLLLPEGPQGQPARVNLVFQAFFSGRAQREPARLTLRVQPFPLTVIDEISLRLVVDDDDVDLGASCVWPDRSGPPCQLLFPCSDGCAANGVSVEVQPSLLERLARARVVTGTALGFPIVLTSDDLSAIDELTEAIGVSTKSREKLD